MKTNDNHPPDRPEYYRAQALKARLKAEARDLPDDLRETYLEVAEAWEVLARQAEGH